MRSVSLICVFALTLASTEVCLAQSSAFVSQDLAIERAIALGKSGQFEDGLKQLRPFLLKPTKEDAKACYVAGFLLKERFKKGSLGGDRAEAIRWLRKAVELDGLHPAVASWRNSAEKALDYLGDTYFNDVVLAVRTFEPGQEALIFELFEAHEEVATFLDPNLDAIEERTEIHKNLAIAYRQWFEVTGDHDHFEGIVDQYKQALALSPMDMTAAYNLAVNIYNRGVAQITAMDENTTLPEILSINESSRALFERALPWFEKADMHQPNRPETLRGLMIVHHALFHSEQEEAYRLQLEKALMR